MERSDTSDRGFATADAVARSAEPSLAGAVRWKGFVVVVLAVVALCQVSRGVVGDGLLGWAVPDREGSVWAAWWLGESVLRGHVPWDSTDNFFPLGQRALSQFNLLDALVVGGPVAIWGARVGYAVGCGLVLWLNGLAGWALGLSCGLRGGAAAAVGLTLQTSVFVVGELVEGRPAQALVAPMVLVFVCAQRWQRSGLRYRWAVGMGLSMALTALAYWYAAVFAALGLVAWCAGRSNHLRRAVGLGLAVLVAVVLTGPAVWALVSSYGTLPGTGLSLAEQLARASSEGLGWLWPLRDVEGLPRPWRLGAGMLLLAGLGVWSRPAGLGRWMWVALVGYLHAVGPASAAGAAAGQWDRPAGLLYALIPFYERLWWPQRASVLCTVALAVLVGVAVRWSLAGLPARRWRVGALGACLVLCAGVDGPLMGERWVLSADAAPDFEPVLYDGTGPVFVSSMDTDGREEARFLLWSQVHHGRPISGGLGQQLRGHEPAGFAEWRDGLRLFQMLRTVGAGGAVSDGLQPEDVQALVDAGFTDVVVDAAAFPAPLAAAVVGAHACVLRSVFGEPAYEGAAGARWAVAVPEAPVAVRCAYDPTPRGRARRIR